MCFCWLCVGNNQTLNNRPNNTSASVFAFVQMVLCIFACPVCFDTKNSIERFSHFTSILSSNINKSYTFLMPRNISQMNFECNVISWKTMILTNDFFLKKKGIFKSRSSRTVVCSNTFQNRMCFIQHFISVLIRWFWNRRKRFSGFSCKHVLLVSKSKCSNKLNLPFAKCPAFHQLWICTLCSFHSLIIHCLWTDLYQSSKRELE